MSWLYVHEPRLRVYTRKFGRKLLDLWKEEDPPEFCLRTCGLHVDFGHLSFQRFGGSSNHAVSCRKKHEANSKFSDKELFTRLEMKDPWVDADMISVFTYMLDHPRTKVPDSWQTTMNAFRDELMQTCADPSLVEAYNSMVCH